MVKDTVESGRYVVRELEDILVRVGNPKVPEPL
jgi:hypothetical protein